MKDGWNGRLVPVQNPEALARAIIDMFQDRETTKRMAAASLDYAATL